MPTPLYLDLFDDGIPRTGQNLLGLKDVGSVFESSLLDTLRFQLLLAILFERRIIVPEAWLLSSSSFLRVAGEFIEHYPPAIPVRDGAGSGAKRALESPFVFAFGPTAGKGSLVERFARSLQWRLEKHKRLMFNERLSSTEPDSEAREMRQQLAQELAQLLQKPTHHLAKGIPEALHKLIPAHTEHEVLRSTRNNAFTHLLGHLESVSLAQPEYPTLLDMGRYEAVLEQEVRQIERAVQALPPKHADAHGEYDFSGMQAFFARIREEQLSGSKIMLLWQHLGGMQIPSTDKLSLEAFGRYVLNRTYASVLGAGQASAISFMAYARNDVAPNASILLDHVLQQPAVATSEAPMVTDFVKMATKQSYDLADSVDWGPTWQQIALFAASPQWREHDRPRLLQRIEQLAPEDRERPDVWSDIFDRINAGLHGHMQLLPKGDMVKMLSKLSPYLSPAAALAGAVSDVPLKALVGLVGLSPKSLPAYAALKTERMYRRTLAHPATQPMLAILS